VDHRRAAKGTAGLVRSRAFRAGGSLDSRVGRPTHFGRCYRRISLAGPSLPTQSRFDAERRGRGKGASAKLVVGLTDTSAARCRRMCSSGVFPVNTDLPSRGAGWAGERCGHENRGRPNGSDVKLRGQGLRGYGSAARRLPACESRDAGGVTPRKLR
jgi:hypothetical protein